MAFGLEWDQALQEIFDGYNAKLSYPREVSTWYASVAILKNHVRAVRRPPTMSSTPDCQTSTTH